MTKISQLGAAAGLSGSELIPVVQDGETKKATADQLFAFVEDEAERASLAADRAEAEALLAANSATAAAVSADDAAQSAAYAGGFEAPEYASQSEGNAATTAGQIFRVPLGTTPQTFNWYRRLASGSELVDPLATTGYLASSAGAGGIGAIKAATGAVVRTILDWFEDDISVMDFIPLVERVKIRLRTATTDLTSYINAAYTAAETAGGREVVWPSGTYPITDKVICGPLSSTRALGGAVLSYAGTGTAFEVQGSNTSETNGQMHVLPYIARTALDWNSGTDTTSVGVVLSDRKYNTFIIPGIKRFNEGLALKADVANFVCNTIQLGVIQNCKISIDFSRITLGWGINQNTFIGGACVIDSAWTSAAGRIYVNMTNAAENNTNTFVGVNLEKGGNEKAIVCAASSNLFLNCRLEQGGSTAGYVTVSGNNNRFVGGAPASSATIPFVPWISDTGSGNIWEMANVIATKYMVWDTHSPSAPLRFGNGSAYPSVPIGPFGSDRLGLGNSGTLAIRNWGFVQQEGTAITSGTTLPWRSALVLTYGSATTVTGMTDSIGLTGTSGLVAITATNGNATLQHTASPAANAGKFVLKSGANLTLTANTPVLFQLVGGNLYQI
jgi:hypothetical protein